ncbi:MAG: hypothetical protein Q7V56_08705 [Gammaproteobacteria bacterium]|nr:hypothetical protein [Gammaproteobacteria bacterium]
MNRLKNQNKSAPQTHPQAHPPQQTQTPASDRFDYDSHNPVPTLGGAMIGGLNVPGMRAGPMDQAAIESRQEIWHGVERLSYLEMAMGG